MSATEAGAVFTDHAYKGRFGCLECISFTSTLTQHHSYLAYNSAKDAAFAVVDSRLLPVWNLWPFPSINTWSKAKGFSTGPSYHSTNWKYTPGAQSIMLLACYADQLQMPRKDAHLQFAKWAEQYGSKATAAMASS